MFNTIATEMESELSSLIDNNRIISVLSDGSTDAGVTEQEMINYHLFDKELKASTKFVDIIQKVYLMLSLKVLKMFMMQILNKKLESKM